MCLLKKGSQGRHVSQEGKKDVLRLYFEREREMFVCGVVVSDRPVISRSPKRIEAPVFI